MQLSTLEAGNAPFMLSLFELKESVFSVCVPHMCTHTHTHRPKYTVFGCVKYFWMLTCVQRTSNILIAIQQDKSNTQTHTHILSVFTHQRVTKEKACMLQKLQTWLRSDKSSKNPNNNSGKMFLSHAEIDKEIKDGGRNVHKSHAQISICFRPFSC